MVIHSCSPVMIISSSSKMSLSNARARFSTAMVELDAKAISSGDSALMSSAVTFGPSATREVLVTEVL